MLRCLRWIVNAFCNKGNSIPQVVEARHFLQVLIDRSDRLEGFPLDRLAITPCRPRLLQGDVFHLAELIHVHGGLGAAGRLGLGVLHLGTILSWGVTSSSRRQESFYDVRDRLGHHQLLSFFLIDDHILEERLLDLDVRRFSE